MLIYYWQNKNSVIRTPYYEILHISETLVIINPLIFSMKYWISSLTQLMRQVLFSRRFSPVYMKRRKRNDNNSCNKLTMLFLECLFSWVNLVMLDISTFLKLYFPDFWQSSSNSALYPSTARHTLSQIHYLS